MLPRCAGVCCSAGGRRAGRRAVQPPLPALPGGSRPQRSIRRRCRYPLATFCTPCLCPLQYQTTNFSLRWEQLGYEAGEALAVRDLYLERDLGVATRSLRVQVRGAGKGSQ